MKTQIIQLDPSDDVISVRDKMGWSQTSRILLVWPDRGQILTRRLDLLLLQRHSTRLGAQLALVTHLPQVKETAQELKLAVFQNTLQAQNTHWRSRRRLTRNLRRNPPPDIEALRLEHTPKKPGWQETLVGRASLFGVSILAILVLMWNFIPGARITLRAQTQSQEVTLLVKAGPGINSVNLAGELPIHIQTIMVEGRDSIPTTGSMLIPGEPASGAVRFTNLTQDEIQVPQGAILTSLDNVPIRFATTQAGTVPAGPGQSLTVPVQALVSGESGNLPPASLTAIEGELGLSLSTTNIYATHGGTDIPAPAPRNQDYQALLAKLTATLRNSALTELQESMAEGDILLTTTLKLVNTLEETYSPPTGLPGDLLELTLRLEFAVMTVNAMTLQALVLPVMDASIPDGFTPQADSLRIAHSNFSDPDEEGTVTWRIAASRTLQAIISPDAVIPLVLGHSASSVGSKLIADLPLADTPEIKVYPTWWQRLPYIPFRIQVIVD